jgi:hypothetical protein
MAKSNDYYSLFRTYNITKKEWGLNGGTVIYAFCESISSIRDYDFTQEKQFSYENITVNEALKHIAKIALWKSWQCFARLIRIQR